MQTEVIAVKVGRVQTDEIVIHTKVDGTQIPERIDRWENSIYTNEVGEGKMFETDLEPPVIPEPPPAPPKPEKGVSVEMNGEEDENENENKNHTWLIPPTMVDEETQLTPIYPR